MAISNYTELKTAVANWLDRDDLTDRIPEFIALAESRFNRLLRSKGGGNQFYHNPGQAAGTGDHG